MNNLRFILPLLLLLASTARGQWGPVTASTYGLRGPVQSVWERTYEYHGILDFLSERRNRVISERWLRFDSLGRLLQEEVEYNGGNRRSLTTYAWDGNVVECLDRQSHAKGEYTNRSVLTYDPRGRLLQSAFYPDGGEPYLVAYQYDDITGEISYFYPLRDSADYGDPFNLWEPGIVYSGQISPPDSNGWIYHWACYYWGDTINMISRGERYDERGRLVERFDHPLVSNCWGPSSSHVWLSYNDHGDLAVVDMESVEEEEGTEYDYRYDERGNWTRRIESVVGYLWLVPIVVPQEKSVRVIEYSAF